MNFKARKKIDIINILIKKKIISVRLEQVSSNGYLVLLQRSGLFVKPTKYSSLSELVRTIIDRESLIPRNRIVLDLTHLTGCEISKREIQELQLISNEYAIDIDIRVPKEPYMISVISMLSRRIGEMTGPAYAMPGMGMGLCLTQGLTQRLEQRLELQLSIKLEQLHLVLSLHGPAGKYDDIPLPDDVPKELQKLNKIICEMHKLESPWEYLKKADECLDIIDSLKDPFYRMLAMNILAEELSRHQALMSYVKALYSNNFSRNFSATSDQNKAGLSLLVAVSQLRQAGSNPEMIKGFVARALGLCKANNAIFCGKDARNMEAVLLKWAKTAEDGKTAEEWVNAYVELEDWVPENGEEQLEAISLERAQNDIPVEDEVEEPAILLEEEVTGPAIDEGVEDQEVAEQEEIPATIIYWNPSERERAYVKSRLIHRMMENLAEGPDISEEIFNLFMNLATDDPWEETAYIAYKLLSRVPAYRSRLVSALSNFSSAYYRAKAKWVLEIMKGRSGREEKARAFFALESDISLTDLKKEHERAFWSGHFSEQDPLNLIKPEAITVNLPQLNQKREIQRYAESCISEWLQVGAIVEEAETTQPSHETTDEDIESPVAADDAELKEDEEEGNEKDVKAKEKHKAERKGELAYLIGRSLIENNPNDPAFQIEAIKIVANSGFKRALALFMAELPADLTEEVEAFAKRTIMDKLQDSLYNRTLAILFLCRQKEAGTKPSRDFYKALKEFLKAASEDESVSNTDAIKDLCCLARNFTGSSDFQKRLLTLARKRLKLFQEKVEETKLDESEDGNQSYEEDYSKADAHEAWKELYEQGKAHVLASSIAGLQGEDRIRKQIKKIKNPYYRAIAYRLRAKFLLMNSASGDYEASLTYMELAIKTLEKIPLMSLRISLGFEIFEDLKENELFEPFEETLSDAIGHPFAEMEIKRQFSERKRAEQEGWFGQDTIAQGMKDGFVQPGLVGRFSTSKQLGKILQANNISPSVKSRLIIGHLKNGPYQNAMSIAKQLIETEEAKPESEHLTELYHLFDILLSQKDPKALEYLAERERKLLLSIRDRKDGTLLSNIEKRWIKKLVSKGIYKNFIPLIYTTSLSMEDRLWFLELLMENDYIDKAVKAFYEDLKDRGKSNVFFDMLKAINELLPGITITKKLIDKILEDPRAKENDANIREVISSWAQEWDAFESAADPNERIRILAENELVARLYFNDESTKFNFGTQTLTFERFMKIIEEIYSMNIAYNHEPVMRYQESLESQNPTAENERAECLKTIEDSENLDEDARLYFSNLARQTEPLTEEQIKQVYSYGNMFDIKYPENFLAQNQRRIYRLYWGQAPIVSEEYERVRRFRRRFSPKTGTKDIKPLDVAVEFRVTFRDFQRMLAVNWSLAEIQGLLSEAEPLKSKFQEQLDRLLASNIRNVDIFYTEVSRLHAEIISEDEGIPIDKVRRNLQTRGRKYINETLFPKFIEAKTHFVASDSMISSSAWHRDNILNRGFNRITPSLQLFLSKDAEMTEQKSVVARRLNLDEGWQRRAQDKVKVEMELLAEISQIHPVLRERFFNVYQEVMQQHARQESERDQAFLTLDDLQGLVSQKNYEVRFIDKRDIYTFIRIGDFRPCCISTNGTFFKGNISGYFRDKMTLVFAIYDPDSRRAVGHMIGHLGLTGNTGLASYLLNGLYMRHQHRGSFQDQSSLGILEEFARDAGLVRVRHGINSYHDLTVTPPIGYLPSKAGTIKLQTLMQSDGSSYILYNDLGIDRSQPNASQETTHYQKSI